LLRWLRCEKEKKAMKNLLSQEQFLKNILNSMDEGLILVDDELRVIYMNPAAEKSLELEGKEYQDKHLYRDLNLVKISPHVDKPILEQVLETGQPMKGYTSKLILGKVLSVNANPLYEDGILKGILITSQEVTNIIGMKNELEMAFTLMLPNTKVKDKLQNTVEYKDRYDPNTKMITITGIIPNGGYRHVINCLRLLGNLYDKGITKVIGINKDQLTQAFIFHDLGKSQPILSIGDVVNPKEVFENGKLHAHRGAEIAKMYNVHEDIVEIIYYHHHAEHELPETFPWRLRPMFRLFQLIDGLSAAITRGEVEVDFEVQDCVITVTERNQRPEYNGTWRIDLFTGARTKISD
jgi:putative nucleotidyltransferase with HDIG domain